MKTCHRGLLLSAGGQKRGKCLACLTVPIFGHKNTPVFQKSKPGVQEDILVYAANRRSKYREISDREKQTMKYRTVSAMKMGTM